VTAVAGTQTCPACGNQLDPMHAPVARIRGGKVVSFCSPDCAAAAPGERLERRPRAAIPALPRQGPDALAAALAPIASEPVPRPARRSTPPPVPVAQPMPARQVRRSNRMDASREYLDVESDDAPRPAPRRGRGLVLTVCALVLAAGVALLVSEVMPLAGVGDTGLGEAESPVRDDRADEAASAAARRAPMTASARAAGPVTPAAASDGTSRVAAAQAELRALMESGSPRVRRLAAQALARGKEPAALDQLRRMAREEPSQLGRIQIAYALARAGDGAAREALRIQLGSERRDVRLDAARSLVQLGDDTGRKTLRAMLSVEQHRVGAAGLLARLGDDEGFKALRAEAAEKRATPEARMRVQVALGRAGDESVKGALHKILSDRRYNVGAADALAALGDDAAAPALTAQLRLSSMRVQAALWLRRLKKDVDQEPLVVAMENGDEMSRVSAAEALLILSGPPALAERE
jgi:HEAT repeat protein